MSAGVTLEAARKLYAAGEIAAAEACLDGVPQRDPAFAGARMMKAENCHAMGRAEDAALAMLPLAALYPDQPSAWANFALVVQPMAAAAAGAGYRRALALAPDDPGIALNAARYSLSRGDVETARVLLSRALVLVPDAALAIAGLAMTRLGPFQRPWLARAVNIGAPSAVHFALASALQAEGDFDAAEPAFRAAAKHAWRERGQRRAADSAKPRLGIGWKPGRDSGWGVYGANLISRLAARGDFEAVVSNPIIAAAAPGDAEFAALFARSLDILGPSLAGEAQVGFPSLVALGNDLIAFPRLVDSALEIGVIFLENTKLDAIARARGTRYQRLVAGSHWGASILRGAGFAEVDTVLQGIDPKLFHFSPRPQRGARFRIFSGGKLEFRKGQDIVIEAFRRFRQRRPDSQLVVAWQSPWPEAAAGIVLGGLVRSSPSITASRRLDIGAWLDQLGLGGDSVEVLDLIPNSELPAILAAMDCALFPNRCEGGTNLVAMECMALGVPTILSANTGHLDLIEAGNCLPLQRQRPISIAMPRGADGWGESDLDEIVERLDALYLDTAGAAAIGAAGAATLARLAWPSQIDRLLDVIGPGR